ncbi:unnamed protein product [Cuscuta epithymum]|uniref:F-box associated beta-propeller type 1 domain-containing protein n=1 Tax=Cuscuta epithymum TaxID=186058 RepID=A0AAV0FFG3_9ASTE|nr:unnamed protein product [Cuscuta epithymum]
MYLGHELFGCSEGMFCLNNYGEMVLWNPFLNQFKHVPKSPIPRLAVGDNDSVHVDPVMFGFDRESEPTGNFKAFSLIHNILDPDGNDYTSEIKHQTEVYSLNTNSWKPIKVSIGDHYFYIYGGNPVHVDGKYYRLATRSCGEKLTRSVIISFDFSSEELSFGERPEPEDESPRHKWELFDYGGLLCAIRYPRPDGDEESWEVFLLKEDGGWKKKFALLGSLLN